jgi:hypothetical protein
MGSELQIKIVILLNLRKIFIEFLSMHVSGASVEYQSS